MYLLAFTKKAQKDMNFLKSAGLDKKAKELLKIIKINPFQHHPRYKKLTKDLKGSYSRRINKQHRIVYDVFKNDEGITDETGKLYDGIVQITSMWGHYE